MAKYCPLMQASCTADCALRMEDECAITNIAKSFRLEEIRKDVYSKLINMRYGTCSDKFNNYVDTDTISESSLEDKYRREGYKNENTR